MFRATSPRKSETQRSALFSGLSQFLQSPGPRQDFQLLSHSCLAFPCSWPPWGRAAPPSPNPGRALASMTANPLHYLGLIRAQWQMISLHIKALKQLNKLAPSQSPAQELALNSEALPAGAATRMKKAPAPHAARRGRALFLKWRNGFQLCPSQVEPGASLASAFHLQALPWLGLKVLGSRLSVIWGLNINP